MRNDEEEEIIMMIIRDTHPLTNLGQYGTIQTYHI